MENTGAELLHLLSEGSGIAPFAELRDRDSVAIADAECRARVAEAPLLVLTNFRRIICFNSDSSRMVSATVS